MRACDAYTHACTHTSTHTSTHIRTRNTHARVRAYTHTQPTHAHTHTHTHTHKDLYIPTSPKRTFLSKHTKPKLRQPLFLQTVSAGGPPN